jgi:membrane fusion protein, copper/silver efflux system
MRGERWKKRAPWIALPVLVVAAFAAGTCAAGRDDGDHDHAEHASDDAHDTQWTCSMHPQIRREEPGQCPICGMDLIPVAATDGDAEEATDPSRVVLSERAKALARLRTVAAGRTPDRVTERRLLGRVDYDETSLQTVTAWVGGRIDRLHVATTGQRVRAGQVIATVYSPELYQAHQDLLVAVRQARHAEGRGTVRDTAPAALQASRARLRLLGVPDAQLAEMEKAEAPWRQVRIRSPFGGTVIERLATEGQYVETGTGLYRVADLRRLWVQLDAYETDLPLLSVGQSVVLTAQALQGEPLEGKVAFVDPVVDRQTRTARVRIEVKSPDGRLRPGMFAEARVRADPKKAEDAPLTVPASAPLFTGRRSLVYVEVPGTERPTYEAREVKLGPRMGDAYSVLAGLREGERVVYQGAFVLDADLQIRGGASMMTLSDDTEPGPYDEVIDVPAAERRKLGPTLAAYLKLQRALADDDLERAGEAAREVREAARTSLARPPEAVRAWEATSRTLREHADHVAEASSLEAARAAFGTLTEHVKAMLRRFGNPLEAPLHVAFCPMAFDDRGATWLQEETDIANPYFGEAMRTCGEVKETLAPGAPLPSPVEPVRPTPAPAEGHVH